MPRPLSSLTDTERSLLSDLPDHPLDPNTAHLLADAAEDQGQHARAMLLHHQPRLALMELLRGSSLTERECQELAARLRTLLAADPATLTPEQVGEAVAALSAALGTPARDALPDLRTPEGVRAHYDRQVALQASLQTLDRQNGKPGITAIDKRFHSLPSLEAIRARLQQPALRQALDQGFDQLLLVPFGLPLHRLIEAWRQCLRRNTHCLPNGLHEEQPVRLWQEGYGLRDGLGPDQDGRLVYSPQHFGADHGGRTKADLLTAGHGGWDVLLTEGKLIEIPRAGQGQTVGGRAQLEAGRSPRDYLESMRPCEVGWTPETYAIASCTQLEQSACVLDAETLTYLLGAYLPASGVVPYAFWGSAFRQASLVGLRPGIGVPLYGVRAAVRVI